MKRSTKMYGIAAVAIAFMLGAFIKDLFVSESSAQNPAHDNVSIGRYQFFNNVKSNPEQNYIFDTATGRCWSQTGGPNSKEWNQVSPDAAITSGQ